MSTPANFVNSIKSVVFQIVFISVIAVKPMPLPYLNALLPKDQDLDSQDQPETTAVKKRKRAPEQSEIVGDNPQGVDTDSIDNPYLRPMKIAKFKKRLK